MTSMPEEAQLAGRTQIALLANGFSCAASESSFGRQRETMTGPHVISTRDTVSPGMSALEQRPREHAVALIHVFVICEL